MMQNNHLDDERAWLEDAMNTHDPDGLFEPTSLLDEFIDTLFDFDNDSDIRSHDVMQPAVAAKDLCMKKLPGKGAANAPNAASVCVKKSLFGKGAAAAVNGDSDFVATTFKPVASIKPANVKKVCGTPTKKKMGLYCVLELNHLGNCEDCA